MKPIFYLFYLLEKRKNHLKQDLYVNSIIPLLYIIKKLLKNKEDSHNLFLECKVVEIKSNNTVKKSKPDYKMIYMDILEKKIPEKKLVCASILNKDELNFFDIQKLNNILFGSDCKSKNQKHRSYSKSDILKILDYQIKHKCNNSQLALHFKLSRNTVAKWKKRFL